MPHATLPPAPPADDAPLPRLEPGADAPARADGGVRFRFEAPPGTRHVAVAGTFNAWRADRHPMARAGGDRWEAVVPMPAGRHLYKFVVDGRDWIRDPANPWESEDGQRNASLTVEDDGTVFLRGPGVGPQAPSGLHRRHAAQASPDWLRDGVLYQLSVRAFGGTFDGVRGRLDHLDALGVDIVWLMPVFPIGRLRRRGTLGDPYAVRDFTAVDPALGDHASLRALVDALHARGKRVLLDWTLNRASCDNVLTRSHPDWFTRDAAGALCYDVPGREDFVGFDFARRDLRDWLLDTMAGWVRDVGFDGLRLDDSDITPTDFLRELRTALQQVRPDIALVSQAYDELHHLGACDLTYEGGTRDLVHRIATGQAPADAFRRSWEAAAFSFPRGALRMRWLDDKEQGRAAACLGDALHDAALTLVFTLDGVPHLLMGQETGDRGWATWTSLFEPFTIDVPGPDAATFEHVRTLVHLRRAHAALRRGEVRFVHGLPDGLVGYRRVAPAATVGVWVNLSAAPVPLPAAATAGTTLCARGFDPANGGTLAARGWRLVAEGPVTSRRG